MTKTWTEFTMEELNKTEVDKWVLVEAKEDATTRLFIHRFNRWMSAFHKDGWWDTFTICDNPVCKGYYLARIKGFRIDKNGYLNMMVIPLKHIGSEIDEDSPAWCYFNRAGLFSRQYGNSIKKGPYNVQNLESAFVPEINNITGEIKKILGNKYLDDFKLKSIFIFTEYLYGKVSLEEINNLLNKPLPPKEEEILARKLYLNAKEFADEYPLTVKKLPKDPSFGWVTIDSIESFLIRKWYEYDSLQLGNETQYLKRVEAVLKYWDDIHKKEKEVKKEKRKAAKEQKKAQ